MTMMAANQATIETAQEKIITTKQEEIIRHSISFAGVDEYVDAGSSSSSSDDEQVVAVAKTNVLAPAKNVQPKSSFCSAVNLCSFQNGARILFATDEWFAAAENLLQDSAPHFDPDAYCAQGKVMDGWESRRRRQAGHDWCIIKLASHAAVVQEICGIDIDTAHFTGNQVPAISLEICSLTLEQETNLVTQLPGGVQRLIQGGGIQGTGATPDQVARAQAVVETGIEWKPLLNKTPLQPGYEPTRMHSFGVTQPAVSGTHIRVNYFPDGGVARLRVWGRRRLQSEQPTTGHAAPLYMPVVTSAACTVVPHHSSSSTKDLLPSRQPYPHQELSSADLGGVGLVCSNRHYGVPQNLLQSKLGRDMGDGWETARHPNRPSVLVVKNGLVDSPLMDWCICKLGQGAEKRVTRVIIDTKHFCGNYPESVLIEGCYAESDEEVLPREEEAPLSMDGSDNSRADVEWFPLVARTRMSPDAEHVYDEHQLVVQQRPVSHIRVSIFPDGGVSRVRVYGE